MRVIHYVIVHHLHQAGYLLHSVCFMRRVRVDYAAGLGGGLVCQEFQVLDHVSDCVAVVVWYRGEALSFHCHLLEVSA